MYRCALTALLAATLAASATAQELRNFPPNTLRGAMIFGESPQVSLNGQMTQIAPGGRVRNQDNRIVMGGTLAGERALVHYTLDVGGAQVRDVWILRPEEAARKPWPSTLQETQSWTYNADTHSWIKP